MLQTSSSQTPASSGPLAAPAVSQTETPMPALSSLAPKSCLRLISTRPANC